VLPFAIGFFLSLNANQLSILQSSQMGDNRDDDPLYFSEELVHSFDKIQFRLL